MSTARDRAIADEAGAEFALRCRAHGCPMLWSVNFGRKLCSAHALATDPRDWPRVTEALLAEETDRARYGPPPAPNGPEPMDRPHAIEALAQVRDGRLFARTLPRDWAHRLEEAERAGRPLSAWQRTCWRQACGHQILDAAARGEPVPRQAIAEALQATGDLPAL
jgi:hypothetical protein